MSPDKRKSSHLHNQGEVRATYSTGQAPQLQQTAGWDDWPTTDAPGQW